MSTYLEILYQKRGPKNVSLLCVLDKVQVLATFVGSISWFGEEMASEARMICSPINTVDPKGVCNEPGE